jgi:hypothetical protein
MATRAYPYAAAQRTNWPTGVCCASMVQRPNMVFR